MKKVIRIAIVLLLIGAVCCAAALMLGAGGRISDGGLNLFSRLRGQTAEAPASQETQETQETQASAGSGAAAGSDTADGDNGTAEGGSSAQISDRGLTADGVTALDLDIDTANCTVQLGESWALSGDDTVSWQQNGGTLKIVQKSRGVISSAPEMTLTIPRDAALQRLEVDADAGTFAAEGLSAEAVALEADAGKVSLTGFSAGRLEADVDAGTIELAGAVTGGAELGCEAGKISLQLQEGSALGTVRGELEAGELTVTSADGSVLYQNDGLSENVSYQLGTGAGVLEVECEAGSIRIQTE